MRCFGCKRSPDQIQEYVDGAKDLEYSTVEEFVRREEGTYNPDSEQFCCTKCYVAIGMPVRPGRGWRAP